MKRKIFYGSIAALFLLLSFFTLYQKPSLIFKGKENFPDNADWYAGLPPCPCHYEEVQQLDKTTDPKGKWLDCGVASQTYHYGAAFEVRWAPAANGHPGQQCTYDENGALITEGIAAGTPDKVSPHTCGFDINALLHVGALLQHKKADVDTWAERPCTAYLIHWPPDNTNHCQQNAVTNILHMKRLVGDMSCQEITALFNMVDQYDSTRTLHAYFHEQFTAPPSNTKELLNTLQERADCKNNDDDECNVILQALNNVGG